MIVICENCKTDFNKPQCHIKRVKHHFCKRTCRNEWQKIRMSGKNNPRWIGDQVGYVALHYYIKARLAKPLFCSNCGLKKKLDLSNKSGKYSRNINDWAWLCRSCHNYHDRRKDKPDWIFEKVDNGVKRKVL